jgi:hypothetical protein
MLMMVWVLARAEVIEVKYSVGFVVYFMALGNFVNVDDDFEFERMLKLSIRFAILKMLKALLKISLAIVAGESVQRFLDSNWASEEGRASEED